MSRLTVTIDEALLEEAKEALGVETRAEAIRTALEEAVRRRRLANALAHKGQLALRGDLAELRRLREEG
jgi:metal-responsive CopG/Arc/MetJ family transcriptional regulator